MAEQTPSLITFYQGWTTYQQSLVEIIAPLSSEQLALHAAPHHCSLERVAQHIVATRWWWFQVWMGQGGPDLAPIARWDEDGQPARSAAELVAALEATWRVIHDALARWTPADLEQIFLAPPGLSEEERRIFPQRTRQWIIWHVLEHEIHHGGELSLALGAHSLPTIYS